MHPLRGRKQSPEHIAKRMAALRGRMPTGGGRQENTAVVIWSKVQVLEPNECWLWKGFRNETGYGRVWIKGKGYYAHRVVYHLANPLRIRIEGPLQNDSEEYLRHKCDNPPCCNPAHLEPGTHTQNMRDSVERGRRPDYSGDKGPRCKLTAEDVFWIKMQLKYVATRKALALLYDVSVSTIKGVLYGRHYRDV